MFNRDQLGLYLVLTLAAIWGGVVSYYRRVSNGAKHALWRFFGEIAASAFSGLCVGALLLESGAPPVWAAVWAGVAGHMGGNAIEVLENVLREVLYAVARVERRAPSAAPTPGQPQRRVDDASDRCDTAPRPPANPD